MNEHTPLPWKTDGVYVCASLGVPTIANCSASPRIQIGQARINAELIVRSVNALPKLEHALKDIVEFCSADASSLGAIERLNHIQNTAMRALAALRADQGEA